MVTLQLGLWPREPGVCIAPRRHLGIPPPPFYSRGGVPMAWLFEQPAVRIAEPTGAHLFPLVWCVLGATPLCKRASSGLLSRMLTIPPFCTTLTSALGAV